MFVFMVLDDCDNLVVDNPYMKDWEVDDKDYFLIVIKCMIYEEKILCQPEQ